MFWSFWWGDFFYEIFWFILGNLVTETLFGLVDWYVRYSWRLVVHSIIDRFS